MKKLIKSVVVGSLFVSVSILAPIKTLATPKTVILEPEISPPIKASNHYVRAEAYGYTATYVKNGITVSLKLGKRPEDTYLTDSSGIDRGILVEVNCKTGGGLITGYMQNAMPVLTNPQPFNLSKSPIDPYSVAISYACIHYLRD